MNYHLPAHQKQNRFPLLGILNNKEVVAPSKVYEKDQYPSLPHTMVKIAAQDGRNIFVPLQKFTEFSAMDY